MRRGGGHPRGLWDYAPFGETRGDGRYIVTDPDVVPAADCPRDWPARLSALLDKYPQATKAGLGLRTDDIPEHYSRRDQVISWEAGFWTHPAGDGAYWAAIDTTLAMYREGFWVHPRRRAAHRAPVRGGPPGLARGPGQPGPRDQGTTTKC